MRAAAKLLLSDIYPKYQGSREDRSESGMDLPWAAGTTGQRRLGPRPLPAVLHVTHSKLAAETSVGSCWGSGGTPSHHTQAPVCRVTAPAATWQVFPSLFGSHCVPQGHHGADLGSLAGSVSHCLVSQLSSGGPRGVQDVMSHMHNAKLLQVGIQGPHIALGVMSVSTSCERCDKPPEQCSLKQQS